jgi:hypothetical protein
MAVSGEKLGGGPADHSARLGFVSGALFLRSSRVRPMLMMACERLPHTWTACKKCTWGIHGMAWEASCQVYQVFPCRVYFNSNRHNSQI